MKKIIIGLLSVSLLTPVYAQTEQVERKGFFQSIAQIFKKKDKDKTKKKDKGPKPSKAPVAVKPQPKMVPLDQQPQDSLNFSMMPKFWRKRDKAVINVGLIYYGENY